MKITITQSMDMFKSLYAPSCNCTFINDTDSLRFPKDLIFNATYYRYFNNKVTAFRILAYAINISCKISYLVQFPNKNPEWIEDFITRQTPIFDCVEQYIAHQSNNNDKVHLTWWRAKSVFDELAYASVIGLRNKVWAWDDNIGSPYKVSNPFIDYFLVCKDGCFIRTRKTGPSNITYYLSKEDCIREQLNGLVIDDFAEEPITLQINVLPNAPKIHTLKFIEEEIE